MSTTQKGKRQETPGATIARWTAVAAEKFGLVGSSSLRDTLETALKDEAQTQSGFSAQEREMLVRLLHFGGSRVEDIMVPRADVIAVDETELLSDLLLKFKDGGVSRVPLYRETLDNPDGMVHIKDLFSWLLRQGGHPSADKNGHSNGSAHATTPLETEISSLDLGSVDLTRPIGSLNIRRPVLYVPLSMPAMNLLIRMQSTRIHMALVVDEYGGTDGLVTIEDLVEQIVGDIEDEHDEAEAAHISVDKANGLVASARTPVEDLEQHLGSKILTTEEEDEIDTLGGLVFTLVGRVPARGEIVRHGSGLEFEVLDADPRRVKKLKIHQTKFKSGKKSKTSAHQASSRSG
ncbi:MAG: hemolysin family protein [Alphaproteobacteria bacterium]|nr:hemolysin family protein [Alphaproteobacteria bacterium]